VDLTPNTGATGTVIARYKGGWTGVAANTISMPLPNYVSVIPPISIGGLTSWASRQYSSSSYITLGDGTFLVYNLVVDYFNSYGGFSSTKLMQGVGVTFPSGDIPGWGGTPSGNNPSGTFNSNLWAAWLDSNYYLFYHSGYAIKLSGVTSGGLGGGAFGGGLQPS
jgi:hypothetical protein